jgi:hypothetical protein
MKHAIVASAILLCAALGTQAYADSVTAGASGQTAAPAHAALQQTKKKPRHVRAVHASQSSSAVTYNRDSKNPNVGWHTQGGLRGCTEDCDNPEIPGSGYTCRDVNVLGMAMRECDSSN